MADQYGSAVKFNAGTLGGDKDVWQFALVTGRSPEGNLDLITVDANGAWQHKPNVPRRDPQDYGPEGGGYTYTEAPAF